MISFLSLFFFNSAMANPSLVSADPSLIKRKPWRHADKMGSIEMIEIDGLVEVPIYRDYKTIFDVFIEVSTEDPNAPSESEDAPKPSYFRLDLSSNVIAVDDAFVEANGLDVKTTNKTLLQIIKDYKVGGEVKYVEIPKLHIGSMTLHNVTAYVTSSEGDPNLSINKPQIGLGALSTAYSILHSQGVAQFAPKTDGKNLLNNVSKEHLRYNSADWMVTKSGTTRKKRLNMIQVSNNIIVDTEILGEIRPTLFSTKQWGNLIVQYPNALEKYPPHGNEYYPNVPSVWTDIKIGSQSLQNDWVYLFDEPFSTNFFQYQSILGTDTLSFLDIAVSPVDSMIAIAPIKEYNVSILDKKQWKELRQEVKEKEEETDETSESTLASYEKSFGSLEKSKGHLLKTIEKNSNACKNYLELGMLLFEMEDFSAAEENLQKASNMYHDWWDRNLDDRLMIQKNQAQLLEGVETDEEKEEIKAAGWIYSQSDECRTADALLPVASFFNGKEINVFSKNYDKNLDLDDTLARITGNYALVQGNLELANEAYRQAILLEKSPDSLNRLGLALYTTETGNWDIAKDLFEEVIVMDHLDVVSAILYVENLRKQEGDKVVLDTLQDLITKIPSHSALHVAYIRELQKQNLDTKEAVSNADTHFARTFMRGYSKREHSCYALYLLQLNRIEEAQFILSDTKIMQYEYLLAKAQLYKAMGDEAQSIQFLEMAKRQGYEHPGYVLLQE